MDPFALLGIRPGATGREIRDAYLRLSRVRHPDKGGSDEAMRELNAAYEAALLWEEPLPPAPPLDEPRHEPVAPPPPVPIKAPRKPIYKRKRYYVGAAALLVFLVTSGATEKPSSRSKPAIYGLIGRCVELVDNEVADVVPCDGPHDAWVVDVVPRPEGVCPPLASRHIGTISHLICINTER